MFFCFRLSAIALTALLLAGCWMGASQHSGPGDDDADDDDNDGASSDADSDSDGDSDTSSDFPPGELLGATSVKASGFYDTIWDMAAMPGGGVVVLGEFTGTAKFDPGGPNETTLSSDDGRLFMAKFSKNLGFEWVRHVFQSGSPSELDQARSIAVHPDGGFVVAGCFTTDATFGPGQANEAHYDEVASTDDCRLFVARFDDDGDLLWACAATAGSDVVEPRVAAAPDGRVLVTATFAGSLEFEGESELGAVVGENECNLQPTVGSLELPSGMVALVAFSSAGQGLWLRGEGLDGCILRSAGLWVGESGNIALAVDSNTPFTVQAGGQAMEVVPDVSILRYNAGGSLSSTSRLVQKGEWKIWFGISISWISMGSNAWEAGIAEMIRGTTDLFLADDEVFSMPKGWDGYTLVLDENQMPVGVGLTKTDTYISEWTYGSNLYSIMDTGIASSGSVFMAGGFEKNIAFATADLETQLELKGEGSGQYMYIGRFSPEGIPDWAVQAGGGASCFARAVAEGADKGIFVGGSFGKNAVFGAGEPGETELSTSGGWDIFLAKYMP